MLHRSDANRLAEAYGLTGPAELVGPADRGELGQVWRLRTGSGDLAVKETLGPLPDEQIARADDLARRATALGVRTPALLRTGTGDLALRIAGVPVRLYRWAELGPADRRSDPAAVGALVAALHRSAPPTDEDVDPFYCAPVGEQRWRELQRRWCAADAPFAAALDPLLDELIDSESIMVTPTGSRRLGHRDLWADNVRPEVGTGIGGSRLVVIDWDNCGSVDQAHELAMILVEFGMTATRAGALCAAYRAAGGPAAITGETDFTMPLAVLGHLLELDVGRWLAADPATPTGRTARTRAIGRIEEFCADPITRRGVRELLVAVG